MDGMDKQTHQPPGSDDPAGSGPTLTAPGPRVSGEEMRDFSRLRRSGSDRHLGGVAGGLGRHFDVDPTLVRVVLVVLTLFGGAGLLVYGSIWLLVPVDGADRAPLDLGPDVAKVLVLVAVVVGAAGVLGLPWLDGSGGWVPWPLVLLALGVAWLVARRRDRVPTQATPAAPPPYGAAPTWGPPPPPPVPPAPQPTRPRRTGVVLFWPTLAVVAVGMGVLGLVDVGADVPVSGYAALALTLTGAALLLGAFRGRPGGLIALGLASLLALGVTSAVDAVDEAGPYTTTTATPQTVADLPTGTWTPTSGDVTLDLTEIDDPRELDGRALRAEVEVGRLTVVLPAGVSADVESEVRWAGEVLVAGRSTGDGTGFATSETLGAPGVGPTLDLDLEVGLGQIEVRRDSSGVTTP